MANTGGLRALAVDPAYRIDTWCACTHNTSVTAQRTQHSTAQHRYEPLRSLTFGTRFVPLDGKCARALQALHTALGVARLREERKRAHLEAEDAGGARHFRLQVNNVGQSASGELHSEFVVQNASAGAQWCVQDNKHVVQRVLESWERDGNPHAPAVRALVSALAHAIDALQCPRGVFVRLSSRSPKDAVLRSRRLREVLRAELSSSHHPHHRHAPHSAEEGAADARALTRAVVRCCAVRSADDALALLLDSARVRNDLAFALSEPDAMLPLSVAVREFVALDPAWELRAFVRGRQLVACSQYHKHCFVPELVAARQQVHDAVLRFWEQRLLPCLAHPALAACQHFTVDLAVNAADLGVVLVEINQPPPIAATQLFDWGSAHDRAWLESSEGSGCVSPRFALRVVEAPQPRASRLIDTQLHRYMQAVRGRAVDDGDDDGNDGRRWSWPWLRARCGVGALAVVVVVVAAAALATTALGTVPPPSPGVLLPVCAAVVALVAADLVRVAASLWWTTAVGQVLGGLLRVCCAAALWHALAPPPPQQPQQPQPAIPALAPWQAAAVGSVVVGAFNALLLSQTAAASPTRPRPRQRPRAALAPLQVVARVAVFPLEEEAFYRWFVHAWLGSLATPLAGAVASVVWFAANHSSDPTSREFALRCARGAVYAATFWAGGGSALWPAVLVHAASNACAVCVE